MADTAGPSARAATVSTTKGGANGRCRFTDTDGTMIEFVITEGLLEEWCDSKLEIREIESLVISADGSVIDDGAEVSVTVALIGCYGQHRRPVARSN